MKAAAWKWRPKEDSALQIGYKQVVFKDLFCVCLPRERALVLGRILDLLCSFVCSDYGLFHHVCITDFSSIIGR